MSGRNDWNSILPQLCKSACMSDMVELSPAHMSPICQVQALSSTWHPSPPRVPTMAELSSVSMHYISCGAPANQHSSIHHFNRSAQKNSKELLFRKTGHFEVVPQRLSAS